MMRFTLALLVDQAGGLGKRFGAVFAAALLLATPASQAGLWVTAYYPGYEQSTMPASAIDFTAVTHIIHFALVVNSNGTLNGTPNSITPANTSSIVTAAHAAKKKVILGLGGADSASGWEGATSTANLATFITNITNYMAGGKYDGVDVDWEPLDSSDTTLFTNFVFSLRTALNAVTPRPLMTLAVAVPPTTGAMVAAVQSQFDQINLMTYDLAGPYEGWVTWYNSPIYDAGDRLPDNALLPSCNDMVNACTSSGVPLAKMAIAIAFYGYIWEGGAGTSTGGVTEPLQSWTTAPSQTQYNYNQIVPTYYNTNLYHWDTNAQAAWLGITNTSSSSDDMFITYDDTRACQAKVSYARNEGLGGVMIFELAEDYTSGKPDPLLQAVKQAMATPGDTTLTTNGSNVNLSFTSMPLGSYEVQWTSNLTTWNSLMLTNVPMTSTGGVIQVTDPGALNAAGMRLYRVETPP